MNGRGLFNQIMQSLNSQSLQLEAMSAKQSSMDRRIGELRPQSYLPMIARPVQGVDYARTCNVAHYVDTKVKEHNGNVGANAPRYLEFAEGRSHDDLNRSALATMGGIMVRKLGDDYGGEKTWEKLYRKKPLACEDILEEARMRPELAVFAQVDGQWCLRELAKNKLKSIRRAHRSQTDATQMSELTNAPASNTEPTEMDLPTAPAAPAQSPTEPLVSTVDNDSGARNEEDHIGTGILRSHDVPCASLDTNENVRTVAPSHIVPTANENTLLQPGSTAATTQITHRTNSDGQAGHVGESRRGTTRRAPRSGLSSRNLRSRNSSH